MEQVNWSVCCCPCLDGVFSSHNEQVKAQLDPISPLPRRSMLLKIQIPYNDFQDTVPSDSLKPVSCPTPSCSSPTSYLAGPPPLPAQSHLKPSSRTLFLRVYPHCFPHFPQVSVHRWPYQSPSLTTLEKVPSPPEALSLGINYAFQ